jgi:sporulation protein YlmC with PRC-barrel domain
MQLSELLGLPVRDDGGHFLGTVIDARVALGERADQPPQLVGVLVSPRSRASFLGYERTETTQPRVLSAILRWRHRGTFLASWEHVGRIDADTVRLRKGYVRFSPVLRASESRSESDGGDTPRANV